MSNQRLHASRGAPDPAWRYAPAVGQNPWREPRHKNRLTNDAKALEYRHVKITRDELDRVARDLARRSAKRIARSKTRFAVFFAVVAGASGLVQWQIPTAPLFPFALFTLLLTALVYSGRRDGYAREQAKVRFLSELFALLRDELHPRAPVRFDFDLSAYDASGKLRKETRSAAGNAKRYFSDKWLRVRVVLADGTRLSVIRQAGMKTKKGKVVSESRRLVVSLVPNLGKASPVDWGRHADALTSRARGRLHGNAPAAASPSVHVIANERGIVARVRQVDVDFEAAQVVAVVEALLRGVVAIHPLPRG
jgi:hypothetical protein